MRIGSCAGVVASALLVALTAGCTHAADAWKVGRTKTSPVTIEGAPASTVAGVADAGAAAADQMAPPSTETVGGIIAAPVAEVVLGSERFVQDVDGPMDAGRAAISNEPVTVNFVDADIRDVARTILGELLGVAYVIDPDVKGRVTLQTDAPMAKRDLVGAFESILRANGMAMVSAGDVYTIMPLTAAQRLGSNVATSERVLQDSMGYRQLIVPLSHVSASEMRKVLEPLAPPNTIVAADDNRNHLTLSGTSPDLRAMLELVRSFDTSWLSAMSFALFTPSNVDAQTLTNELSLIFKNARNPSKDLVDLIPISRLNAVLAISPRRDMFAEVMTWVTRLDRRAVGAGRRIHFHRIQNGKAAEVARVLGDALGIAVTGLAGQPAGEALASPPQARGALTVPGAVGGAAGAGAQDGLRITADERNNALLVYGTAQENAAVEDALRQIDTAVPQVLIEATIAEVKLTDDLKYGVQWFLDSERTQATLADTASGLITSKFPGLSVAHVSSSVQVTLNALSSLTRVQVISSPRIMALTNQTAMIQVGDQVPIVTQAAVGITNPDAPVVNSVQMRDTGIILRVTPRINNNGIVVLEIEQEVSNVVGTTTSGIDSPTIQQRLIRSTVAIPDGETAILGGLIRNAGVEGRSGLPFLKDIPAVGDLFGTTSWNKERTELLVFLRPRIIRTGDQAQAVAEQLKRELRLLEIRRGVSH